jgi:small-conductance mechanosensitive channel/CRP-like cAMP-binding protein
MTRAFLNKSLFAAIAAALAWWLMHQAGTIGGQLGLGPDKNLLLTRLAESLLWIAGAHLFNVATELFFWRGFVERALGRKPPRLVEQLGHLVVMLVAVGGILGVTFEQPVTGLWATSGAVGIVVGLALRNLILDTFSGLAINLEQPFRVGDWITFNHAQVPQTGRVIETNWRTTRLITSARNTVVIPNSVLTSNVITNYSMNQQVGGFELDLSIDHGVPTERVLRILGAAAQQTVGKEGIRDNPAPELELIDVSQNGIVYRIKYFVGLAERNPGRARSLLLRTAVSHLRNGGVSLSYPRRDVFVARMPWRQRDWHVAKDQVRQLAQLSLFSTLTPDELTQVSSRMIVHHLAAEDRVVTQGDPGESMFLLAEGLLKVSIRQEDGRDLEVAELGPGSVFGERSLLTGEARSASVACATDAVICEIPKDAISALLAANPELAQAFSREMVTRDTQNKRTRLQKRELDAQLADEAQRFASRLKSFFGLH